MLVYRVAKHNFARDISGEGARLAGGRWNSKGIPVLYTSDHPAVAFLEAYAGIAPANLPPTLKLVTIAVDETVALRSIPVTELADNWDARPPRQATMRLGDQWLKSQATLLLKVPSAVVPPNVSWNIMVNPMHPLFATSCKIISMVDWNVDFRLKQ